MSRNNAQKYQKDQNLSKTTTAKSFNLSHLYSFKLNKETNKEVTTNEKKW